MKIKSTIYSALIAGLCVAGLIASASAGDKEDQAKLEAKAKVTKAEAQKIALAKVPNGTVKDAELEEEDGKLIWSFDITTPNSKDITEVNVDAKTGEVVSVEKESPADQAKEKAEDAKKEKKD
jgi:uncharacterized membrane protein YkoI